MSFFKSFFCFFCSAETLPQDDANEEPALPMTTPEESKQTPEEDMIFLKCVHSCGIALAELKLLIEEFRKILDSYFPGQDHSEMIGVYDACYPTLEKWHADITQHKKALSNLQFQSPEPFKSLKALKSQITELKSALKKLIHQTIKNIPDGDRKITPAIPINAGLETVAEAQEQSRSSTQRSP